MENDTAELDPASAVAFLKERRGKPREAAEISPEEAVAFLRGVAPAAPTTPGPLGSFVGSALESTGTALRGLGAIGDYMQQMAPPSTYGGRGPMPSRGETVQAPQGLGTNFLGPAGGALERAGQAVYPPESRGRGSLLGERIPAMLGQLGPGLAAGAINPGAGAATFGAQFGAPAYFETLKKTGDQTKAVESFLGNAAIAQLNELGFGAPLKKILGKFGTEAGKKALSGATVLWDIAKGVGQGNLSLAAQTGLSGKLDEILTGKDRDLLKEMGSSLTSPEGAAVGGFLGFLGALQRPAGTKKGAEARPAAEGAAGSPEPIQAPEVSKEPEVTEAEKAWARRFLGRPEPKEGPIGVPDVNQESIHASVAADRAAGKAGPIRTSEETSATAPSPLEQRARALHGIETIGKAVGASEDELASSRRLLRLVPDDMLDAEFAEQAKKLRGRGQAIPGYEADVRQAALGAPEEPLLAPRLEEGTRSVPELPAGTKATEPIAAMESAAPKVEPKAEPEAKIVEMMAGLPPLRGKAAEFSKAKAKEGLARAKEYVVENLVKSHGGKPELAARMEERAKGEVEVEASRARSAARQVERAVKLHNKRNAGAKVLNEHIQEALQDQTGAKTAALPEGVRQATERLREHADRLSRAMIDEGMTNRTMTEIVNARLGEYLRTAYKAHVDPEWAKKVPEEVRNKFESLLVSWSQPPDKATLKQLRERAYGKAHKDTIKARRDLRKQIDALKEKAKSDPSAAVQRKELIKRRRELGAKLKPQTMDARKALFEYKARKALQGKTVDDIRSEMRATLTDAKQIAENPWAAFAKSSLKRKDVSLFKARKGMPDELKAYLGEEKDPLVNYTNTILKQAQFIANHRKFVEMRAEGLGKWLFEKPTTKDGAEYVARVSAADNPRLAPLVQGKDLYTTEKIKKALFDSDKTMLDKATRWAIVANAVLKGAHTVYQPYGAVRQAWQQIPTLVRNGYMGFALKNARRIFGVMHGKSPEHVALREEMTRQQVLDTSVAAAEFKDLKQVMASRQLNEPYRTLAKANEAFASLFSQPDNFTKIAAYQVEKKWLKKAGLAEDAAQREAANIVRNITPTYSRIVPAIQRFRRQPFLGTFMAFKAEQVRTSIEMLRQIGREMKSDNPVLQQRGRRRAATLAVGLGMAPIGAKLWNMLNGVDQEQDDRNRSRASSFDTQRNLLWLPNERYVDISDLDDGSWITDPLARILAGADAEEVVEEMRHENLEPFTEASLFSKALVYFATGRDEYGKPMENRYAWLAKQVLPTGLSAPEVGKLSGLGIRKLGLVRSARAR